MPFTVKGEIKDSGGRPIAGAAVSICEQMPRSAEVEAVNPNCDNPIHSAADGTFSAVSSRSPFYVNAQAFGKPVVSGLHTASAGDVLTLGESIIIPVAFEFDLLEEEGDIAVSQAEVGRKYWLSLQHQRDITDVRWEADGAHIAEMRHQGVHDWRASIISTVAGPLTITATIHGEQGKGLDTRVAVPQVYVFAPAQVKPSVPVALQRSAIRPTGNEDLWTLIRANKQAIEFKQYQAFITEVLCQKDPDFSRYPTYSNDGKRFKREKDELVSTFSVGVYDLLRTTTELFLLLNCRVATLRKIDDLQEENARRAVPTNESDLIAIAKDFLGDNPYIRRVIAAAFPAAKPGCPFADGVLLRKEPCLIELIWSYWHEEAMLTQSVHAIMRRFQNHHARGVRDPLAHLDLDPLRPLNNVMWGYAQQDFKRLTVPRRSLEYNHEYGLTLFGRANPGARSADPRSRFLESFHHLLHRCAQFFKEDNDTTKIADGYPLNNALRETHLLLAQGAGNQFGDLPWTARVEMLIEMWIMARGETRDFLQSRTMVPYLEAWMPQVDTMKTLQGWTDVSVSHFSDLANCGEQILLSIRYGDWVDINDEDVAKNWARYWRPEIQRYLHAYRAVAGVDLTNPDTVDATLPGIHLLRRMEDRASMQ